MQELRQQQLQQQQVSPGKQKPVQQRRRLRQNATCAKVVEGVPRFSWTCCNPTCGSEEQQQSLVDVDSDTGDASSSDDSSSNGPFGCELRCQAGAAPLSLKFLLPMDLAQDELAPVLTTLATVAQMQNCSTAELGSAVTPVSSAAAATAGGGAEVPAVGLSSCPLLPPGAAQLLPLLTVQDGSRIVTLTDLQGASGLAQKRNIMLRRVTVPSLPACRQ